MENALTPLLVILGPTGSGKSRLGLEVAEEIGGEIVSADAFAIYRELDIGTDKPTIDDRQRVPHHLVDVAACATSEIVYRLIQAMGLDLDVAMATAIYTGILTDTGSFRFSNTNRAAFAICEAMVAVGVNPSTVAQHVYGTYSLGRIKLLNLALDSIEISPNGHLSIMTVTREMLADTDTQPEDADGLINYARRIRDVKVAALIHELDNGNRGAGDRKRFHVSLRSDGSVDVARIASGFGGGGHAGAAGFSAESSLADLKRTIYGLSNTFGELCQLN